MNELATKSCTAAATTILAVLVTLAEMNLLLALLREGRTSSRRKPPRSLALLGLAFFSGPALAAQPPESQPPENRPPEGQPADGGATEAAPQGAQPRIFSLQLSLDATTAYFYHGIMQEDTGPIIQPGAQLTFTLCEQEDFKLDAFVGTWHSFHGQKTWSQTDDDFRQYWYEADLSGGLSLEVGNTTLTTSYILMTSPNNGFETVQELDFTLSYNDADLHGPFALNPYATLAFELGANGSDGADSDRGIYLELGIAPGFTFDLARTPVTLTFPASIGLSIDRYYQNAAGEDDFFGYAQAGILATLPITDAFGQWSLQAGLSVMHLGDNTAEFNGGQDVQFIATLGLQAEF